MGLNFIISLILPAIGGGFVAGLIADGDRKRGAIAGFIAPIAGSILLIFAPGSSSTPAIIATGFGLFGLLLAGILGLIGGLIGHWSSKKRRQG
ncbi:MAG: DUF5518 domain-containing protein [Candidatus Micrarchaeota archaeon]|nr:DUF5518 domain-containing protein [Candidatus Micrarchaeota archaeon]